MLRRALSLGFGLGPAPTRAGPGCHYSKKTMKKWNIFYTFTHGWLDTVGESTELLSQLIRTSLGYRHPHPDSLSFLLFFLSVG